MMAVAAKGATVSTPSEGVTMRTALAVAVECRKHAPTAPLQNARKVSHNSGWRTK